MVMLEWTLLRDNAIQMEKCRPDPSTADSAHDGGIEYRAEVTVIPMPCRFLVDLFLVIGEAKIDRKSHLRSSLRVDNSPRTENHRIHTDTLRMRSYIARHTSHLHGSRGVPFPTGLSCWPLDQLAPVCAGVAATVCQA